MTRAGARQNDRGRQTMDILRQQVHHGEMGHAPTVTAITVAPVARAARAAGVDPAPALARLGLSEQAAYEDRIPLTRLHSLWETLLRSSREPALPALAAHYRLQDERSLL